MAFLGATVWLVLCTFLWSVCESEDCKLSLRLARRISLYFARTLRSRRFLVWMLLMVSGYFLLYTPIRSFYATSIWDPLGNQNSRNVTWGEIALQLFTVTEELKALRGNGQPPSKEVLHALQRIASQLDPELFGSGERTDLNSDHVEEPFAYLETPISGVDGISNNQYAGVNKRYHYVVPIQDVVSIVLNPSIKSKDTCLQYLSWTLRGIHEYFPNIPIYVASRRSCQLEYNTNVQLITVSESESEGNIWTKLISSVSTPYVFLGRDIFHFTNLSLIERLMHIIEGDQRIQVAGGSTRNLTGHWHVGCFQTYMHNYVLEYTDGYYKSINDCMVCDHISGPFLARTNIFQSIPIDVSLNKEMIFNDFFLRLKNAHRLAVVCPDAMHFANKDSEELKNKEMWTPLVKKWELNQVLLPKGVWYEFSCYESGVSCKYVRTAAVSFLNPPCCFPRWTRLLIAVRNTGAPYELDCGTDLGAVKMQGFIPWDWDVDLDYSPDNYSFWRGMKGKFSEDGILLYEFDDFLRLRAEGAYIEMFKINLSNILLPQELRHLPTLVEMHGEWFRAFPSPGLFARNRYGQENLRHAQSYRYYKAKNSYSSYKTGLFLPCQIMNHHACDDLYPTDGNIAFKML